MKSAKVLRDLLNSGKTIMAPGVYDGLSSRLVSLAGFDAVYASGGAIARASGYPDIGLLSFSEVVERIEKIVEASDIPVIADADTGFGGTANVQRTVRALERIGVAAFHLEDQTFPKRCGHLDNKSLIDVEDMCQKIKVARASLQDTHCLVIARTDAIAIEGFDAALVRAQRYVEAGADMIFVEAPQTLEQIQIIAQRLPGPKLMNMFYGGKTPLVSLPVLAELGYQLVIVPSDLQRAAIHAMQKTLAELQRSGDSHAMADELTSFSERELIVQTAKFLALDNL
ncbi:isocitrate lyase/PEP mutase family protein [Pseudomonas fluorescens]|uniref:Isocitrate lyase/PEP mutase family protein n=1 Tax=Pseudomonas fluorescens TaxID=294 RepID=A0AAE2U0L5_PSEFL|nr:MULTISPECIES: isocitrate lyase/PEP mutase family protein [Pseudomonas fluorescens group]MBA1429597.1 isocitrate lyase/PEP mutase family protein [Pseudomonas orientalis]MBD8147010.1 isocitrate lyase/PEP mutase family protein [Pseudomonas fluorescens]MBD8175454.1 isocitrate lyase/PEP mutase family protein [Pseudomonas fluorescens]MBD8268761.1 isocitrate lyase/PEP mutase family protein [Pseudomonas fluorescens]MBD8743910.1 isocitrate lyase/PEP mutase family protein [Pseudomonas fluorescens]